MFQLFLFYVAQKSRNKVKPKEKRRKQALFCFLLPRKVRTNKSTLVTIKNTNGCSKNHTGERKKNANWRSKKHTGEQQKKTNNNWIAAPQISHIVFPQVEEKHVVDLKTTGARGWGPAAPMSKKKTE